jgi:hypothetical protein
MSAGNSCKFRAYHRDRLQKPRRHNLEVIGHPGLFDFKSIMAHCQSQLLDYHISCCYTDSSGYLGSETGSQLKLLQMYRSRGTEPTAGSRSQSPDLPKLLGGQGSGNDMSQGAELSSGTNSRT